MQYISFVEGGCQSLSFGNSATAITHISIWEREKVVGGGGAILEEIPEISLLAKQLLKNDLITEILKLKKGRK